MVSVSISFSRKTPPFRRRHWRRRDAALRKQFGLKARVYHSKWQRLTTTPLPGIAVLRDGRFLLLGKASEDQVLVQNPSLPRPILMSRAEFEAVWDGRLVLMTRRVGLTDLSRRFDIGWFIGAIHKYRHLLGEVLAALLFLQLFALVSPLFFQVVIDKVLVNRTLSTLDVLVIGSCRDFAVRDHPGTPAYLPVLAHDEPHRRRAGAQACSVTSWRCRFLISKRGAWAILSLGFVSSRDIPNFLTSSALTLVIDLLFTLVFLAVMYLYSPLLTVIVVGAFPLYIGISVCATPFFRERLNEKFARGAENQAFLVESVTGIETLKAMAVEPQMQRHWEEQNAGYVSASFRVISLGNTASQTVQFINKLVTAGVLYFGAKLVIEGSLTVGELVAFNILAGKGQSAPVLSLGADVAGLPPGSPLRGPPWRHPQYPGGADL